MKMKRKDIDDDDVCNEFSDFSLSSPARKIRRLDVGLPPIIEEDEPQIPLNLKQTEACLNEERAFVLYKPVRQQHEPCSIVVNQDMFPSFRNGIFWHGHSNLLGSEDDQSESKDGSDISDNSLAVVPWVSYKMPSSAHVVHASAMTELSEPMEADDAEGANMEIEEEYSTRACDEQTGKINGSGDVLHQWHQQHCMSPQLPLNTTVTPLLNGTVAVSFLPAETQC